MKKITGLFAVIALLFAMNTVWAESTKNAEEKITINLASRILTFWRNGKKVTMYPIAVGTQEAQTPVGKFSVLDMEVNPEWIDPKDTKKKVPSGEENPLGYRWIRFYDTYGIHGTNRPDSVGSYVSNGCIRLKEENVEELYELTDIGTPVEIAYERVVIERLPDGRVAYYIYPDGYERQKLDVATVKQALAKFGVADLVSDAEVAEKIDASDGQPTFLNCTYRIEVDDLWVSGRAINLDNEIYLPLNPIVAVTKQSVGSDWNSQTLSTSTGSVKGKWMNSAWYVRLEDVPILFGLTGSLDKDGILRLRKSPMENTTIVKETSPSETPTIQPALPVLPIGTEKR